MLRLFHGSRDYDSDNDAGQHCQKKCMNYSQVPYYNWCFTFMIFFKTKVQVVVKEKKDQRGKI